MLDARSSFYACLCTETKSRSTNSQRKERGQYPAILTEQTWSLKDLLYGFRGKFFLRDIAGSHEWARQHHLDHLGSQSLGWIQFILPAHGASHIINISINPLLTSLSFCSLPLNLNATPPHYHSPKPTEGSRNGTMKRAITRVQFWIVLYYMWVQFIVDYLLTPRVFLQVL